ncbi:short-chain alcohol dehydrogenase [Cladophialophora chaetospira]|uniref:Short-chain alcohol dehydrogenase n=1 Tax=Cladophialophora chaetospira TaxID=386627 RepID=A0AA38X699_9EURO|nr:short-chain alcohol dehydrogenase [Cladophialophora chaetospira]
MANFLQFLNECWPPRPKLTEKELGDQAGKIFIVTGTTAGVGKELTSILYSKNGKIYTAARSSDRAQKVNSEITRRYPESKGELVFLKLDLEDLNSVKAAAEEFLSKESQLDVLWNNAAVMLPAPGSTTKQGWDMQLGVNCLAPFLFTRLLTPMLKATAAISPTGSVRVVFVASSATYLFSPKRGIELAKISDKSRQNPPLYMYSVTKAGNALHAMQFAKMYKKDGVVAVSGNPGNLNSDLPRNMSWWERLLMRPLQYAPIYGAYTELYGGLSPDISINETGAWLMPWGRIGRLRHDLELAAKSKEEGGTGIAEDFWVWSEEQVREYL